MWILFVEVFFDVWEATEMLPSQTDLSYIFFIL